jgi:hypothetical protein
MKVIIEFDGNEEKNELQECLDAWKWKMVACDLNQELRNKLKYESLTSEQYEMCEKIKEQLNEIILFYNLNLD